jgi:2'-5' RNA ligase
MSERPKRTSGEREGAPGAGKPSGKAPDPSASSGEPARGERVREPVREPAREPVREPAREPVREPVREPGKRLFVGARVSVATANALASASEILARRAREAGIQVKWVPPVNYHVTLKFLGWTRVATLGAVQDALVAATRGVTRLAFRTSRIGAFPSMERANVVWAGVEEEGGALRLAELARQIDAAMAELGFAAERRAFHPHVTLGRLRDSRPLREVVSPVAEQMFGETRIEAITLFESEMKSSGSVYTEISRIAFKDADPTAERQTRAVDLSARDDTDDGWPRGQGPNH